jgi:hypothetical protein
MVIGLLKAIIDTISAPGTWRLLDDDEPPRRRMDDEPPISAAADGPA